MRNTLVSGRKALATSKKCEWTVSKENDSIYLAHTSASDSCSVHTKVQ